MLEGEQMENYKYTQEIDEELTINLKKIFFALWSRKELIIKTFLSVLIFFIVLTFILPKKYVVDSDLYVNKSNNSNMMEINPYAISELGAGGGMAAIMAGGGGLSDELELIQSPLVIDNVIKENDLRFKKIFGIIPTRKTGKYLTTEKFLKKGFSVENKKGTNVITIEYKSKDRELAYNVVNSVINNYVQLHKELNTEKSKSDIVVLETEYNNAKAELNKKMNSINGIPAASMGLSGGISAFSAFSNSARKALSNIQGQYVQGIKSETALREEAEKVTELAKKLEWAKLVDSMSDTSKVLILKEPRLLQDYEQSSPKLFINILLGIIFGILAALFAVIFKENTDKQLSYSMLGDEIVYNIEKDFIDFKSILLAEKKEALSVILFENVSNHIMDELHKYKNINIVKADISDEFEKGIENSNKVITIAQIAKTDSRLFKKVKQLLERMNKKIIVELLV